MRVEVPRRTPARHEAAQKRQPDGPVLADRLEAVRVDEVQQGLSLDARRVRAFAKQFAPQFELHQEVQHTRLRVETSGAVRRPCTPRVHNARVDSLADRVPTREELCLPILRVLHQRGGSASIREISEDLATLLELRDPVREVAHGNGPQTEFDYQAAWHGPS